MNSTFSRLKHQHKNKRKKIRDNLGKGAEKNLKPEGGCEYYVKKLQFQCI